ncbi:MAG: class I SAM-dependent methyltransferase [Chitinophagaceae bacterium]|nr:class I SAM-dependent methyltransferase [Chitinophagaceae bacterium]MCW5915246.1 class I SAM-dependent methyltransferase [Chitinophagaceae bacterium]MCZ2396417.1 class I SAM-dependent methyltransferase [Chitinophagales bacterium]
MYSRFQLAKKYLHFYRHAHNSKGHGVHSPFVFNFIQQVKNSKFCPSYTAQIESHRSQLLKDNRLISVDDFGAGSHLTKGKMRRVKDIAAASPKSRRLAQLIFRIASHYNCRHIIELGTSFGITTAYLSAASEDAHVTTIEGSKTIAHIAQTFFNSNHFNNITLINDTFDNAIPSLTNTHQNIDLLFIDGNHKEAATIRYFLDFLPKAHNDTIFIFDDIHWSGEMENAWKSIIAHERVTMTIDLFFIGLVFFRKEFLVKQDFRVRL